MIGEGQVTSLDVDVVIRGLPGNGRRCSCHHEHRDHRYWSRQGLQPLGYAKKLGLKPINSIIAFLASGEGRPAINYAGILEIPAIGYSKPIEMTAMTEGFDANHVLLGKNFLREFLVTIDCANNLCWFNRARQHAQPMIDDE